MFRTDKTVGLLKAIALIAGLSILLWSLGLPSLKFANAVNLTLISDTITDSAPSASADHEIAFTHPATGAGVGNGNDIVLDFSDGPFNTTGIGIEDVSLFVDGADFGQANWSLVNAANVLTITIDTGSIGAGSSTVIYIGNNASNDGGVPDTQIANPAAEGSYELGITADADTGATRIAIIDSVTVTASVDTVFTFAVSGVGAGVTVNGDTTTGTTSTTSIPFGKLSGGSATTTAQQLTVNTNASNGYVVTVQLDQALQSSTGADIDGFNNGSDTDTPATWAVPSGNVAQEDTWGHWGFTSDDATTTRDAGDEFDASEYAAASTTPRVVMSHDGPANGIGTGVGTTLVGYKIEITNLQEAGDDYSTTLTYIATPTF